MHLLTHIIFLSFRRMNFSNHSIQLYLHKFENRFQISKIELYSLLADECTDVNNWQSLSICVRHLDEQGVSETFLAVVPLSETNASTIKDILYAVFQQFSLPLEKCVSVSFDGAANFSGSYAGAYGLMKEDLPHLLSYMFIAEHIYFSWLSAIVKESEAFPPIKRIISLLRSIY